MSFDGESASGGYFMASCRGLEADEFSKRAVSVMKDSLHIYSNIVFIAILIAR